MKQRGCSGVGQVCPRTENKFAPFRIQAIWIIALSFLFALSGFAQERFTDLNGTVKDATGAVIPGATVTITNKNTQRSVNTKTDANGAFVARQLEPGPYQVEFEAQGFQKYVAANVELTLGREYSINPTLQVGQAQSTVQVTEAAPLIDTTGVTIANNISAAEFERLPKARSFQSLLLTSPSVNTGQIEGGFQINGASGSENQFFIDGISTNSLIDGRSRQNAAYEFLQEVQVKTGGIEAEFGGALGGVVSAVTRSGGNAFHGEVHYYFSGNQISAGPVKRLLLLNPYSNLGTDPRYEQDYKPQDNLHEPGASLGGYFIKDRLWFYTSYSPQFRYREQDYLFSNGLEPDTLKQYQRNMQLFNKLSYDPIQGRLRTNFSWLWTPTRTEGQLLAYNGYGNSHTSTRESIQNQKTQGWTQPQSNYNGQIDWTITPTSLLTVRGGRFYDNFRTWGIPTNSSVTYQTPATAALGVPAELVGPSGRFNTQRLQNTFFDITTRTYYQVDFSKFVSNFFGGHDIKIGGGTQKTVNKVDVSYPGGGYVFAFWDTALQRNDGTTDRGQYGYYEVHNLGTRGSTGGTISNLYIQDRWRIHPRVTLNLGLRTENERVPSFDRTIRDNAFSFDFQQKLSPRLGIAWDIFGDGRMKAYGSWGRYYDWVKYETSRGTFGGDFWTVLYRSLDTTDVFSLSGTNTPGRNLWNQGAFEDRRHPSFDAVARNLKPMSTDLINAGIEYQINPTTVFRANYVHNNLVRTIEDLGALDAGGNEVYIFANPGEGDAKLLAPSTATPEVRTPKPQRVYDAMELVLNRRFSNRFFGQVSYTLSRLYGNYAGLGNSDEISTPTTGVSSGTTQQSGGSIARPGSTGSRAWDIDQYLFDSRGNYVYGRLATDRPHVVKIFGSYQQPWGRGGRFGTSDLGGFFYGGSGTPISTVVNQVQRIPLFVNGRGDLGRTPFLTQTDLVIGHEFRITEGQRLRFEFNAQNVFNQKTARHIFNQLNRGAGSGYRAAAINLSNVNLYNGYDYNQLLSNIAATGVDPYDPRFGRADLFNPGFAGRFMVKYIF
jgi:hypothetical protein